MRCRFAPEALPLEATPVDNLFILENMPLADGTQLRVYLFGLMLCRYPSFESSLLGETLCLSGEEVLSAFAYWQKEGLVRVLRTDPLEIEYLAPSERGRGPTLVPGKYGPLIQAAQSLLAPRTLRPTDLRKIYDWVDVFGLSEEAVLELISHCLERKGPRVSMTYIDTVAQAWADDGIYTGREAKSHADAFQAVTGGAAEVLRRWNMARKPTQDELHLYEKWTQNWGFTKESVLAACPAVTKAERPTFAYLDGILERLHGGGAHLPAEVASKMEADEESITTARKIFARMGVGRGARPAEREQIIGFLREGMEMDTLLYVAEQASFKERSLGYFKKLLSQLAEKGLKTLSEAQQFVESSSQGYTRGKATPKSMNYPQRSITEADIAHIFVNLDEEV